MTLSNFCNAQMCSANEPWIDKTPIVTDFSFITSFGCNCNRENAIIISSSSQYSFSISRFHLFIGKLNFRLITSTIWQYGLSSFQGRDKKIRLIFSQITQGNNSILWVISADQFKIGHHFRKLSVSKTDWEQKLCTYALLHLVPNR